MSAPDLGPIGTARPTGRMDRKRSLEVARCLTPDTVSTSVLARLHDRSGIDERAIAVIDPDGGIPLYGIDAEELCRAVHEAVMNCHESTVNEAMSAALCQIRLWLRISSGHARAQQQ